MDRYKQLKDTIHGLALILWMTDVGVGGFNVVR